MSFIYLTVLLCLIGAVCSKPAPRPIPQNTPTTTGVAAPQPTICGDIIDEVNEGFVVFFASDAYDCLTSVPFNPAVATRFIDYYNTTIQFQSTLAYLKDPPQGYQQPAANVLQGLELIQQNVDAGSYKNQYAFEADLQLLIYSMHDAHVALTAGALSAFSFASPYAITSASIDGRQSPQVYLTDDILGSQQQGWKPSPIVAINGDNTTAFLTKFAALNSVGTLEPHADWNELMTTPPLEIQGYLSVFAGAATFYPGDNLTFTLENGTNIDTFWLAIYNNPDPTGPLSTGGDFYNYFVLGLLPASYNASSTPSGLLTNDTTGGNTSLTSWSDESSGAYPDNPDVVQLDLSIAGGGIVTGYFLHDISTGVLSIPSFDQSGWDVGNFSLTVQEFINGATAAKLSKVVIDLQQNTGGNIELVFDIFKRFFPDVDPFAGSRRRSHELANVLGGATTGYWDSLSLDDAAYYNLAADEWVITDRLNADTGRNFTSWSEYFGPLMNHGDSFSLTERYNLSSVIFDAAAFDGWIPYGYGPANPVASTQPWRPEDVVILTDGLCSSACSLFLEMMTHQAGVRTVVVGGRPTAGPMQAASGTRGARVYSADALDSDFEFASSVNQTANSSLPQVRDSGMFTIYAGFNLRDQIRPNDTEPLQFKYEAADCRLYYTLANVYNMSQLWRDTARAIWDDPSLCVADSTGYTTSSSNTTHTAKPPPPRIAQQPSLNLTIANHAADLSLSLTELTDGRQPAARIVDIQACDRNGGCQGPAICKSILVTCTDNSRVQTRACLPSCQNRGRGDSCNGANVFCDVSGLQESKLASINGASSSSPNANFGGSLRTGLCKPQVGTPKLGCPV